MASIAYSTWKRRPSGENVFTPLKWTIKPCNVKLNQCAYQIYSLRIKSEEFIHHNMSLILAINFHTTRVMKFTNLSYSDLVRNIMNTLTDHFKRFLRSTVIKINEFSLLQATRDLKTVKAENMSYQLLKQNKAE